MKRAQTLERTMIDNQNPAITLPSSKGQWSALAEARKVMLSSHALVNNDRSEIECSVAKMEKRRKNQLKNRFK